MRRSHSGGAWLLSAPALILFAVFLLVPLFMTLVLSFHSFDFYKGIGSDYSLKNYVAVLGDSYYWLIFGRTFWIAIVTTAICTAVGVPVAYFMARMSPRWRSLMVLIVLGPLLISVVVRTLGWSILLGNRGVLNHFLMQIGLIDWPIKMMYTTGGIILAMCHVMIPFMILAVWAALQRRDPSTEAAAESLGASAFTVFRRIVLPQAMPGVLSGALIVFSLSASSFATPAILGGRRIKVVATTVYDEFMNTLDWPLGAAISMVLLASVLIVMLVWNRLVEARVGRAYK